MSKWCYCFEIRNLYKISFQTIEKLVNRILMKRKNKRKQLTKSGKRKTNREMKCFKLFSCFVEMKKIIFFPYSSLWTNSFPLIVDIIEQSRKKLRDRMAKFEFPSIWLRFSFRLNFPIPDHIRNFGFHFRFTVQRILKILFFCWR